MFVCFLCSYSSLLCAEKAFGSEIIVSGYECLFGGVAVFSFTSFQLYTRALVFFPATGSHSYELNCMDLAMTTSNFSSTF